MAERVRSLSVAVVGLAVALFVVAQLAESQTSRQPFTEEQAAAISAAAAEEAVSSLPTATGTLLEHSEGCLTNVVLSGNPATFHYWTTGTIPVDLPPPLNMTFQGAVPGGSHLKVAGPIPTPGVYLVSFSVQYQANAQVEFTVAIIRSGPGVAGGSEITFAKAQLTGSIGVTKTGAAVVVPIQLDLNDEIRLAFFGSDAGTLSLCDVSMTAVFHHEEQGVPPG